MSYLKIAAIIALLQLAIYPAINVMVFDMAASELGARAAYGLSGGLLALLLHFVFYAPTHPGMSGEG